MFNCKILPLIYTTLHVIYLEMHANN